MKNQISRFDIDIDLVPVSVSPKNMVVLMAALGAEQKRLAPWLYWAATPKTSAARKPSEHSNLFLSRLNDAGKTARAAAKIFWMLFSRTKLLAWKYKYYQIMKDGELAGMIGLDDINTRDKNAVLWYCVREKHEGTGLIDSAIKLIEGHFLRHGPDGMARLYAKIEPDNEKSLRAIKRAGWKYEGTLKDDHFNPHKGEIVDRMLFAITR
ncbi:MAG: GNAT family N-acetyltransferase [Proteobacteria bacterium]|nr:GNAT family N-acetyltransferase [Pseudomonadota bacterium]